MSAPYTVYLLACADGTLYAGVTTDVTRRVAEHNSPRSNKGAKYTKTRRPTRLVYTETCPNRSAAQKREAVLKSWTRARKLELIQTSATQDRRKT